MNVLSVSKLATCSPTPCVHREGAKCDWRVAHAPGCMVLSFIVCVCVCVFVRVFVSVSVSVSVYAGACARLSVRARTSVVCLLAHSAMWHRRRDGMRSTACCPWPWSRPQTNSYRHWRSKRLSAGICRYKHTHKHARAHTARFLSLE